jgi:hypothetical protein
MNQNAQWKVDKTSVASRIAKTVAATTPPTIAPRLFLFRVTQPRSDTPPADSPHLAAGIARGEIAGIR